MDGVFVGPADLAADLGCLGRPGAPEVQAVVEDALTRIAKRYLVRGATFVGIGSDVGLLGNATTNLLGGFRNETDSAPAGATSGQVY